ncbi:hypothetical protein [Stenotrophomonas maltophilia]|uniref:hypothetical protein n=1 Tax=Stenotrophomonas maltophilia TaxID=40324 RepID=UPI000D0B937A|nr:hypothetical protein [Stenotrophomonas maltophilia]AVO29221.1 hypothetical protein C6Y55_04385 [Stenotrophomonas maltophilia]
MPEAAVWVVAAVAVYAIGVAIYAIFCWPWSRAQRALRRLQKHGVPIRFLRRAEARALQLIEYPAGAPVFLLEGPCAAFIIRSRHPPAQRVQTLAGVPVKYPAGLERAVRAGSNTAEVVPGREHAMIVRLNGVTLAS